MLSFNLSKLRLFRIWKDSCVLGANYGTDLQDWTFGKWNHYSESGGMFLFIILYVWSILLFFSECSCSVFTLVSLMSSVCYFIVLFQWSIVIFCRRATSKRNNIRSLSYSLRLENWQLRFTMNQERFVYYSVTIQWWYWWIFLRHNTMRGLMDFLLLLPELGVIDTVFEYYLYINVFIASWLLLNLCYIA